jgi:fosfomycin resistance protein FosX
MIQGISHITFVVKDLEKMTELLTIIFDAKEIYSSGDETFSLSKEKFFLINDIWIAIMEGQSLSDKTYNHIAFKVSDGDLDKYSQRIASLGLELKQARSRMEGEGQSLYFYDFDNHLFELHTGTLEQRLNGYKC